MGLYHWFTKPLILIMYIVHFNSAILYIIFLWLTFIICRWNVSVGNFKNTHTQPTCVQVHAYTCVQTQFLIQSMTLFPCT